MPRPRAAMMADVVEVEVVVAHSERATLRVGDVFLKIDSDQTRTDVEVAAMAMVPVPTPQILWRKPPASRTTTPSPRARRRRETWTRRLSAAVGGGDPGQSALEICSSDRRLPDSRTSST